jgi:hypothetical protein
MKWLKDNSDRSMWWFLAGAFLVAAFASKWELVYVMIAAGCFVMAIDTERRHRVKK